MGEGGFGHHLWGQDGSDLRGGLAGGGGAENLQALAGVDEGEEVDVSCDQRPFVLGLFIKSTPA